ncbi:MAG: nucleoside deaminase [Chitinophagaceae bacterium]|nr:MAG: nucleoside deaminase [Chitinophagaceae bacterium]
MDPQSKFMNIAIELARQGMNAGAGGPFGCVIVRDGEVIASGYNSVTSTNDPTAHAEVVAIRNACKILETYQLNGCELYTSCEPCPMCLGAIYWARPDRVYFAAGRKDAAAAGFDDHFIYDELNTPLTERKISMTEIQKDAAVKLFDEWNNKEEKTRY